jgi:hypothetical protein
MEIERDGGRKRWRKKEMEEEGEEIEEDRDRRRWR